MIRVAMLADYPIPEEIERSVGLPASQGFVATPVVNLVDALGRRGDAFVEVVRVTKGIDSASRHELSDRVRLHLLPVPRVSGMPVGFVPRLLTTRKHLRRLACDIVHGQGTEAGYAWIATWVGLPNVITVHGILRLVHGVSRPPIVSVEHIGRWIETATFKRATNIIAISDFVHAMVSPMAPRARFFSAGNPISRDLFEAPLDGVSKERLVVYLGRISPEKGLIDLIQAARMMDASGAEATIAVVGRASGRDGHRYEAQCRAMAEKLTIVDVEFRGWRSGAELRELLQQAACVVLPSHIESAPMALAESMALGAPAVAYASGGIPERIDQGVDGFLVPDGDVAGLARELMRLLDDRALASRMGQAAREKARMWHPDVIAGQTVDVYKTILAST